MKIYELSAVEMRAGLDRGELSSLQIVKSLHERADEVGPQVNGFTRELRQSALAAARRADQERARGDAQSPIHGLPLTVKDNIDVEGCASTLGLRARLSSRASQDAVVVELARRRGAVVLGKSNVPQALLPMHCENAVFGATSNPWSRGHVSGGSSGGEAALLASGQSVLGLGTDLGGSIRFPAAFCGVVGLKPTTGRWSNVGLQSPIAGQELVPPQVGPMARTSADLALLFRALDGPAHAERDPRVPPVTTGDPESIRLQGLRLGYYEDDGFISPAPACRRAVEEARIALENAGATLVALEPPDQEQAVRLFIAATSSDGMRTYGRSLAGEAIVDSLKMMWRLGRLPRQLKALGAALLPLLGERRLGRVVAASGERSVAQLWQLAKERNELQVAEAARWQAAGIQGLLSPASASPAVPIEMAADFSLIFSYFGRYNLLGYPAAVVPVTRVRPEETRQAGVEGRGGGDRISRRATAVAERSAGLPVAVQIVGPAWREDIVLALMMNIEKQARKHDLFPSTPIDPQRSAG